MDVQQERTWVLSIHITDLSQEKTLRVSGDMHIGGVMFKLVESIGEYDRFSTLQSSDGYRWQNTIRI